MDNKDNPSFTTYKPATPPFPLLIIPASLRVYKLSIKVQAGCSSCDHQHEEVNKGPYYRITIVTPIMQEAYNNLYNRASKKQRRERGGGLVKP